MPEIFGDITIYNFLTGLIMTGSLWEMLLITRMLAPFPQGLTRHPRNTILVKSFRNNSLQEFNRKRNVFTLEKSRLSDFQELEWKGAR
jgi:hypothetical protein